MEYSKLEARSGIETLQPAPEADQEPPGGIISAIVRILPVDKREEFVEKIVTVAMPLDRGAWLSRFSKARNMTYVETRKVLHAHLTDSGLFLDKGGNKIPFKVVKRRGSVRIDWEDGPPSRPVMQIIDAYGARGFDPTIDLLYHEEAYLREDGRRLVHAGNRGTIDSRGCIHPRHLDFPDDTFTWEPVSSGIDYVSACRRYTIPVIERFCDLEQEKWGVRPAYVVEGRHAHFDRWGLRHAGYPNAHQINGDISLWDTR